MASYKMPVLFCASSFLFLFFSLWHGTLGSSPRNAQRPHTRGSVPVCHTWFEVSVDLEEEKENVSCYKILEKGGENWGSVQQSSSHPSSYRTLSPTGRGSHQEWCHRKQSWLPTLLCASEIACTIDHLLWLFHSSSFAFSLGQEENHSWCLCCPVFFHFLTAIISWNLTLSTRYLFNFLFSKARFFPLWYRSFLMLTTMYENYFRTK